jgi:ComF family protein
VSLIKDFIFLLFPRICASCGNSLLAAEEVICLSCEFHLPKTHFHLMPDNPVTKLFWGRVQLESAASFLYFNKGSHVQKLIHQLKYKGRKDIGIFLGKEYGLLLRNTAPFSGIDVILPVPLHPKRLRKRGYNQSETIAEGLSVSMMIPHLHNILIRKTSTETQTKKTRFERWKNVTDAFSVPGSASLVKKHVLLVDDVITTGATLESCINTLSAIEGIRISLVTLAYAPR